MDSACGYATYTLMPPNSIVLIVEFKVNFMSPVQGVIIIAEGRVLKLGRSVTVCQSDVFTLDETGNQKHCATMLATMIRREINPLRVQGEMLVSAWL